MRLFMDKSIEGKENVISVEYQPCVKRRTYKCKVRGRGQTCLSHSIDSTEYDSMNGEPCWWGQGLQGELQAAPVLIAEGSCTETVRSRVGGDKANMESAVKENTLKLFCESEINCLINALSTRDGCGHGAQQQGSAVAE